MGRFSVSVQKIKSTRSIYVCAFSAEEQAALDAQGDNRAPTYASSFANISLIGTMEGRSETSAQAFADLCNEMRTAALKKTEGERKASKQQEFSSNPDLRDRRYRRFVVATIIGTPIAAIALSKIVGLFRG